MASSTQSYRYNGMVVDVRRIVELDGEKSRFQCLVRGYGHGNPAPRKKYTVEAETNAQASRIAFQMYKVDIDKDDKNG